MLPSAMNGCKSPSVGLDATRERSEPRRLYAKVRSASLMFSNTPLHPQWFSFKAKERAIALAVQLASGLILDIGCGEAKLRNKLIATGGRYVGLDYPPTGRDLYGAYPDVFADAACLPFASSTFDCVLLLDVLEHLRHPSAALAEAKRVLKPEGVLLINVPYLYPLHDEPHDYQRLTLHGLRSCLSAAGLVVSEIRPRGAPTETAALLLNIALARLVVNRVKPIPLSVVIGALLAPFVTLVNLIGWTFGRLGSDDNAMPFAYWVVAKNVSDRTQKTT